MSDVTITFVEDVINITLPDCAAGPTLSQVLALLNSLDEYNSDEAAVIGGVAVGGWYVASDSHGQVKGGTLTQVR